MSLIDDTMLPLVEEFYTLQGEGWHTGRAAWFIRLGGCDVGCSWCDAKETWNPKTHPPVAVDEIVRRATADNPARAVVITGGEPLIYPLDGLCDGLHAAGIEIFLETSGSHPFSGSFDWVCLSPKRRKPPLEGAWAMADELKVIVEGADDIEWAEECASRIESGKLNRRQAESNRVCSNCRGAKEENERSEVKIENELRDIEATRSENCALANFQFSTFNFQLYLQPEWSRREEVMPLIVEHIKRNPRWRSSLQSHKYMRIP
ncbi:MAG: 7-carboxy-7-deazaguanine synthase QueE [Alistipes sp.]|nr:7-carboxy-7-deazaguanine synthase QueE [Alistipes sp.]